LIIVFAFLQASCAWGNKTSHVNNRNVSRNFTLAYETRATTNTTSTTIPAQILFKGSPTSTLQTTIKDDTTTQAPPTNNTTTVDQLTTTDYNDCIPDPCKNNATCTDEKNDYTCECLPGWEGKNCEINHNDCQPNPCQNGATCNDEVNDYTCHCLPGWEGKNCTDNHNDCESYPCQNNATCNDEVNDYTCVCLPGWKGKNCEIFSECYLDDQRFMPVGIIKDCLNSLGGKLKYDVDSVNFDDHADFLDTICQNVTYSGSQREWFFDRKATEEVGDESDDTQAFVYPEMCTDYLCSRACDKLHCYDNCNVKDCYSGFFCLGCDSIDHPCPDAKPFCLDKEECVECMHDADCKDPLLPHCIGNNCTNNAHCDSSPCQNNGTCIDVDDSYHCVCKPGYTGHDCETDIDDCESSPCQNDGTCIDGIDFYNCTCKPGYTGHDCEIDIDDCESSPCFNNGTCIDGINFYNCTCMRGYTGHDCEIDIDYCESSPCENNGTCFDGIVFYNCTCMPGYSGYNCEIDIDDCEFSPCQNNGTCIDGIDFYNCTCTPEWTGHDCELESCLVNSNCSSHYCGNGGCQECSSDDQCNLEWEDEPICVRGGCYECGNSSHCKDPLPYCYTYDHTCKECGDNSQCNTTLLPFCDTWLHECVGCLEDHDCVISNEYCASTNESCTSFSGFDYKNDTVIGGHIIEYHDSLENAITSCDEDDNCKGVTDDKCKGYTYLVVDGSPFPSDYGDCSWVSTQNKTLKFW